MQTLSGCATFVETHGVFGICGHVSVRSWHVCRRSVSKGDLSDTHFQAYILLCIDASYQGLVGPVMYVQTVILTNMVVELDGSKTARDRMV